jgi:hypothetical protein
MRHLIFLALSGCGIVAGNTGCDLRTDEAANGFENRCQERTGFQGNALYGEFCEVLGGIDVDGGCPDEGKVAGCDISAGFDATGKVIDWYYAPETREQIETSCLEEDGEIVDP